MALVANSFLKSLSHQVTSGEVAANTITQTFSDRVENLTTLCVYYNGQMLETSANNPNGKFYYSVVNTLDPSTISLSGSSAPVDASTIAITVTRNLAYRAPGYASGVSVETWLTTDNITISYYYQVYTVA